MSKSDGKICPTQSDTDPGVQGDDQGDDQTQYSPWDCFIFMIFILASEEENLRRWEQNLVIFPDSLMLNTLTLFASK